MAVSLGDSQTIHDADRPVSRAVSLAVVVTQPSDDRIVEVNQAACDYFGRCADDLLGMRIDDLVVPDLDAVSAAGIVAPDADRFVLDRSFMRADGTTVHGRMFTIGGDGNGAGGPFGAATVCDTGDLIRSQCRLELLNELADLVRSSDRGFDDAEWARVSNDFTSAIERSFGWSARLAWNGLALDTLDRCLPPPSPAPGVEQIVERLIDRGDQVGTLTVGIPVLGFDETDRQFVATLANLAANLHLLHRLHERAQQAMLFEAGFESTRVGIKVMNPDGTIIHANSAFVEMLGYDLEHLIGRSWRDISHPDDAGPSTVAARSAALESTGNHEELKRYLRADGTAMWAHSKVTSVADPAGRSDSLHLSLVVDLTHEVETRIALDDSEQRYRSLVEPSVDLILRVDACGRIVDANTSARNALDPRGRGLTDAMLIDVAPDDLRSVLASCLDEALGAARATQSWRHWVEFPDRSPGWYSIRVEPEVPDPDRPDTHAIDHAYLVLTDVTELVESEIRLSALSLLDPLTGCSSRAASFDRLEHALSRIARHPERGVAAAILDLDHFKAVNDTFGHWAGDKVLKVAAAAVREVVRDHDTVGRLGGDEFIVVFEDVADRGSAEVLGVRLGEALEGLEVEVGNNAKLPISASIGVAWTDETIPTEDLVARADRAMFEARRHGRGNVFVAGDTAASRSSSSDFLRQLAAALRNNEFRLFYQPIVETSTGSTVAVEALLRWQHPHLGLMAPDTFLAPLLQIGLIEQVGHWVVHEACRQLAAWESSGVHHPERVHFNATPAELADRSLVNVVTNAGSRFGIDPKRLCVEVTEQALAGTVVATSALAELAEVGPTIVLDDFGTGVSSLTHLRTRPLDGIKIDRMFVAGASTDPTDLSIVEAMISLAGSMGISVVAEGVETPDQLAWLTECGCDLIQGWVHAKAMPPDELIDWVGARIPASG